MLAMNSPKKAPNPIPTKNGVYSLPMAPCEITCVMHDSRMLSMLAGVAMESSLRPRRSLHVGASAGESAVAIVSCMCILHEAKFAAPLHSCHFGITRGKQLPRMVLPCRSSVSQSGRRLYSIGMPKIIDKILHPITPDSEPDHSNPPITHSKILNLGKYIYEFQSTAALR